MPKYILKHPVNQYISIDLEPEIGRLFACHPSWPRNSFTLSRGGYYGSGSWGKVYELVATTVVFDGSPIVLKYGTVFDLEDVERISQEQIYFHRVYGDPCFMKVMCFQNEGDEAAYEYFLVMKAIPGCSVERFVKSYPSLSKKEKIKITLAILKALKELHRLGIIHGDLKPPNINIVKDFSTNNYIIYFLDFGFSYEVDGEAEVTTYTDCWHWTRDRIGVQSVKAHPYHDLYSLFYCLSVYQKFDCAFIYKWLPNPQAGTTQVSLAAGYNLDQIIAEAEQELLECVEQELALQRVIKEFCIERAHAFIDCSNWQMFKKIVMSYFPKETIRIHYFSDDFFESLRKECQATFYLYLIKAIFSYRELINANPRQIQAYFKENIACLATAIDLPATLKIISEVSRIINLFFSDSDLLRKSNDELKTELFIYVSDIDNITDLVVNELRNAAIAERYKITDYFVVSGREDKQKDIILTVLWSLRSAANIKQSLKELNLFSSQAIEQYSDSNLQACIQARTLRHRGLEKFIKRVKSEKEILLTSLSILSKILPILKYLVRDEVSSLIENLLIKLEGLPRLLNTNMEQIALAGCLTGVYLLCEHLSPVQKNTLYFLLNIKSVSDPDYESIMGDEITQYVLAQENKVYLCAKIINAIKALPVISQTGTFWLSKTESKIILSRENLIYNLTEVLTEITAENTDSLQNFATYLLLMLVHENSTGVVDVKAIINTFNTEEQEAAQLMQAIPLSA
ncbi:MAG: hypothetical protein A3E87_00690 [Gammaproteobacteria bacterium RIFCSPHIGHO2_12_FULL_35_23]|nr:MAG: hypothetical protein A3E87_00690 [Gammaproteobacteria bacterium RIFCSPHIGHO2_12_FULL_35_23]